MVLALYTVQCRLHNLASYSDLWQFAQCTEILPENLRLTLRTQGRTNKDVTK